MIMEGEINEEMAENPENPVLNYKRPKNPYKVAFTGIYGVGKTSLFRSIFNEPPPHVDKRTHEEIFHNDETIIPVYYLRDIYICVCVYKYLYI